MRKVKCSECGQLRDETLWEIMRRIVPPMFLKTKNGEWRSGSDPEVYKEWRERQDRQTLTPPK